ncbi:MAG: signal peptide peptidase SppA, partial [Alistipes sp.]|nr:signal peptide peptidase SppA [Alistipes sp.]
VKAVVLRVNSPGGSALASDVIWHEMELLKAQKPVIVSMGSYAASGGYYISAPADAILSDRMTLTGSIGVFGMFMNPTKALQKNLGITMDGVKTNRSAGMGQREPLTAAERRAVMRGVDKVYERFTGLVSEGRNLPIEKVLEIAGGRVWSGSDALEIGLVDGLGGLKMALALAAEKADLGEDFQVVEKTEVPTGFAAVMSALSAKVKAEVTRTELEMVMEEYQHVKEALQQEGIVMYSPYRLELN